MPKNRQFSFAGGELTPSLYARTDVVKYATGLRTCRNNMVMRQGGTRNRPGTAFVAEVKDSSKIVRLVPFVFNTGQTYVLEFGDLYIRFYQDGVQFQGPHTTNVDRYISAITQANPGVVTLANNTFVNGDRVYISSVNGMTQVNDRYFLVAGTTGTTFQLQDLSAVNVNTTGYSAYTSGGDVVAAITAVSSTGPYGNIITSPRHGFSNGDEIAIYGMLGMTELNGRNFKVIGANPTQYSVTNMDGSAFNVAGFPAWTSGGYARAVYTLTTTYTEAELEALTFTQQADIITIAHSNHHPATLSRGTVAWTLANVVLGPVSAPTITSAPIVGGTYKVTTVLSDSLEETLPILSTNSTIIAWIPYANARHYNIYKKLRSIYGFIGITADAVFTDAAPGITADIVLTPPETRTILNTINNYPAAVADYQLRRVFAGTNNEPETVWTSRTDLENNFTFTSPPTEDGPVTFALAGRQVNRIRHLLDAGKLWVFTSGGEYVIEGDQAGILRPTDINARQRGTHGIGTLAPIVVGENILYVQARNTVIRDMYPDYKNADLTVFSAHLFDDYTLVDMAYQEVPHSVVWAVRNDGTLLGLTYVRDHEIWAWHRHDTDGTFENVCVVPEGSEDAAYFVVNRTIDGDTKRYIERLYTRQITNIKDAVFMDSAVSYDGRHLGSITMTLSGGTAWLYTETLTLTSSSVQFAASDVGNAIHLTGSDGTEIRFTITGFTSSTVVTGQAHKTVPVVMRSVAITTWADAVDRVSGLWHLEGKEVSVFADGFVVGNPNDSAVDVYTVADGSITLDRPYGVIHVGLPYISDLETLDIDVAEGDTLADNKKLVTNVTVHVEETRGLWAGPKPPTDDTVDTVEGLVEAKVRNDESVDEPIALGTGIIKVVLRAEWNSGGRVFLRQISPIPTSILAITATGMIPITSRGGG